MADEEKKDSEASGLDDAPTPKENGRSELELEDEITRLENRIIELEQELERHGAPPSGAVTWAGWILGTLAGATCLVLIVVLLGGGRPGECDCADFPGTLDGASPQQQQASLERLLRRNSSDFQGCLEEWATGHAEQLREGLSILVRLEINANDNGVVQRVSASGEDLPDQLGTCLEQRVRRWEFPGAGPYTLELPFAFEARPQGQLPAGDASPRRTDASR